MRRGMLMFIGVGLLGSLAGCSRGVCDCLVAPISHGTPSPIVKPASGVADQTQLTPTPAQMK
jgi:hypothetical protein